MRGRNSHIYNSLYAHTALSLVFIIALKSSFVRRETIIPGITWEGFETMISMYSVTIQKNLTDPICCHKNSTKEDIYLNLRIRKFSVSYNSLVTVIEV